MPYTSELAATRHVGPANYKDELPALHIHVREPPPMEPLDTDYPPRDEETHFASLSRTVAFHFARGSVVTQLGPKFAGLAAFCAIAAGEAGPIVETATAAAATFAGAASGSWVLGNIARHQVDMGTTMGKAVFALSTVAGAAAGVGFAIGSLPVVVAVGTTTLAAGVLLGSARLVAGCKGRKVPQEAKAAAMLTAAAAGVATFWAGGYALPGDISQYCAGIDVTFMARQTAIAWVESLGVEALKLLTAKCGPSIERSGLTLDGSVLASLKGTAVYLLSGVLVTGMAGAELLPARGVGVPIVFAQQVGATALSCIANGMRDSANALAVKHTWTSHKRDGAPDNPMAWRAPDKTARQKAAAFANKVAVRALLNLAKNTVQISAVIHGLSVRDAIMIAQASYITLGAQWREVIVALMEGQRWADGEMARPHNPPALRIVIPSH